ncbi:hypothetical protein [Streptomyces vietnamensis]
MPAQPIVDTWWQPGRVTILTSDVEDITMLTADHSRVTAGKV